MTQLAFVIDLKRCIGCDTCIVGCKVENVSEPGRSRLKVHDTARREDFGRQDGTPHYYLPTMCHHCVDAPCITACPANSLWRNEADGMVMLDTDKCIGCRRCEEACPYDAISFDAEVGTADKCTMCSHRVERDEKPSCVVVCPTRAIHFGDIHDPQAKFSELLATREHKVLAEGAGARPQIYYLEP
jgi:Fe-S-cluster-containing dehydrogenase component